MPDKTKVFTNSNSQSATVTSPVLYTLKGSCEGYQQYMVTCNLLSHKPGVVHDSAAGKPECKSKKKPAHTGEINL